MVTRKSSRVNAMKPKYAYYLENKIVIEKSSDSIFVVQWSLEQLRIGSPWNTPRWEESFYRTLEYVKTEKPEWLL